MSGIFGYFKPGASVDARSIVARMGERMSHRDYYRTDVTIAGEIGALGRLGIGLLNHAPQPVHATDRSVTLFLCGEFYHVDQRRVALIAAGMLGPGADDAEMALQIYLAGGANSLAELEGMYTCAVWDERTQDLWVVNDRYGLYPHYYAHVDGAFIFAPEIKGVQAAPGIPRILDNIAIAQYARFQQLLGERTWFQEIHLLPPATILHFRPDSNRLTFDRYWDWHRIAPQPSGISLGEAAEETIRLFQRAVDAMTRPPLRVGVFLSGGLDGRAILGFARERERIATCTFGAPGCRDVLYAERIARRAGSTHKWTPLRDGRWVLDHWEEHLALTEGMHSWMHGHGMGTLRTARAAMDVNLSGWDGGTILGGYIVGHGDDDQLRHAPDEATFAHRLYEGFCGKFVWPGLTDAEAENLFSSPGDTRLRGLAFDSLREELRRTAHYPAPYRADYFYLLQHCRRSTQNMIVFARSAIEVRCPFFDYEFVSFLYGLPEHLRSNFDLQRLVLTRRMPDLARIPNEKDDLPPHTSRSLRFAHKTLRRARRVANRVVPLWPDRTRLYADYEGYLRGELREWAEAILFSPRSLERGIVNPGAVRQLWERHQRGGQLWTIGKIAPLITLELVLRHLHDDPASAMFDSSPASARPVACD